MHTRSVFAAMCFSALAACNQAERPAEPTAAAPAPANAVADGAGSGGPLLKVVDLAQPGEGSKGTEVYVRVVQNGQALTPATGAAPAGWHAKGDGVYLRVVPAGSAEQEIAWTVPDASKAQLYFSNTAYSGKVKVTWQGVERTYDLYSPEGAKPRGPVNLSGPLPERY